MKTKSYKSMGHVARALNHKAKYGSIYSDCRIPRKLKKAAKKFNLY